MIEVIKISAEETYLLRKKVLRKGIDLPFQFDGDKDRDTFHLGLIKKGFLVGIATFIKKDHKLIVGCQYQLRGMAIVEEKRGLGLGNFLLKESFIKLKEKKVDFLWCNARELALGFYLKNGFKKVGSSFEIHLVGKHFTLVRKL